MSKIKPRDDYERSEGGLWLPRGGLVGPDRKRPNSRRGFRFSPGCCCGSGGVVVGFSHAQIWLGVATAYGESVVYELSLPYSFPGISQCQLVFCGRLSCWGADTCLGPGFSEEQYDTLASWINSGGRLLVVYQAYYCPYFYGHYGDPDYLLRPVWNDFLSAMGSTITFPNLDEYGQLSVCLQGIPNTSVNLTDDLPYYCYCKFSEVSGGTWLVKDVSGSHVIMSLESIGDGWIIAAGSMGSFSCLDTTAENENNLAFLSRWLTYDNDDIL